MQSASGAKPRRTSRRKGNPEIMEMPELHGLVALRAYQLFEKRGRAHGRDWDDWFRAQREILGGKTDADLG
jgi:hypothetical protein